jgi:hypothetical protein
MGTGKVSRGIPARVEGVRRRLERWRGTRRAGARIPEPLWSAAVKVAERYGIHRTTKALRLDYYSLKRRVEREASEKEAAVKDVAQAKRAAAERRDARKSGVGVARTAAVPAPARFVELPVSAWAACGECTLELERPCGTKLRVCLKGMSAADVAAIGRGLWQVQP